MAHEVYVSRIRQVPVGIHVTPSYFKIFGVHFIYLKDIMRAYKM